MCFVEIFESLLIHFGYFPCQYAVLQTLKYMKNSVGFFFFFTPKRRTITDLYKFKKNDHSYFFIATGSNFYGLTFPPCFI